MATTATKQQSQSSPSSSSSKAATVVGTGSGIGGSSTPSSLIRGGYAVKVSSASPKSPSSIDSLENSSVGTFHSTFQQRQQHNFHTLTTNETDDDIESIAKQISDHAEAIYQTWKARGLAPTEILNCHSVNSDAFDKTLTPVQRNYRRRSGSNESDRKSDIVISNDVVDHINTTATSTTTNIVRSTDANMSNNNLKKLVSSFVNEDKARQQTVAARKTNILTSGTIKDALRKFESADCTAANIKPNYLKFNNSSSTTTKSTNSNSGAFVAQSIVKSEAPKLQQQQSPPAVTTASSVNSYESKLSENVPDVLINTIEKDKRSPATTTTSTITATVTATTASPPQIEEKSAKVVVKTKPETPAKPASLLNHTPAWPLKNRPKPTENGTSTTTEATIKVTKPIANGKNSATPLSTTTSSSSSSVAKATVPENDRSSNASVKPIKLNNLMDEVQMEEERLINALKTGTVLNNDKILPEVITSTLSNANSISTSIATTTTINSSSSSSTVKSWNGDQIKSSSASSESNETDGIHLKLSKTRPKNDAAVPHPDVSLHTNKSGAGVNARTGSTVPAVRPFLTRGSVAERVLMFEKCPEIKALRNAPKDSSKLAVNTNYFHRILISRGVLFLNMFFFSAISRGHGNVFDCRLFFFFVAVVLFLLSFSIVR